MRKNVTERAFAALALVVGLFLTLAYALRSETMKLSTLYPAPVAAYARLVTIAETLLARDEGKVVMGRVSNPMQKLAVAGDAAFRGSLVMKDNKIANLSDPTEPQDVATKAYADRVLR